MKPSPTKTTPGNGLAPRPPVVTQRAPVSRAAKPVLPGKTYPWVLNCIPSKKMETDWHADVAAAAGLTDAAAVPPKSIDLRDSWWAIGNQGDTGSCVGWAVGDGVLRYQMVKARVLAPAAHVSVRYLWMAAKETDSDMARPTSFIEPAGTFLKAALDVARKFGVVDEALLPLDRARLYEDKLETFYAVAAQRRIASYFQLGSPGIRWKNWLAKKRPIATRLDCDSAWMDGGKKGVLDQYDADDAVFGGHAVAIVGFDNHGFIVRNSWGTDWGDKGFGYVSNDYAKAAFKEAYGVTLPSDASDPR